MASFASEVSVTQSDSFFSRFGRFGGNMKLFQQLLSNDEHMKAWVQSLLVSAPVEHLAVPISYQLPPYAELNGTTFDWAGDLFGDQHTWEEHRSVRGLVDRTPGKRELLVKQFTKEEIEQMGGRTSDNVITWAQANGYRVAVREELVSLGQAHPNLQRQFLIVALGSSTLYDGRRCVAVLHRVGVGRYLDFDWFAHRWQARFRFLLVRLVRK